jgi:hypothetical protein
MPKRSVDNEGWSRLVELSEAEAPKGWLQVSSDLKRVADATFKYSLASGYLADQYSSGAATYDSVHRVWQEQLLAWCASVSDGMREARTHADEIR